MASLTYPTLEHVAMEARPYPTHLLEGCETGLILFAARWMGHNDAVWYAQAGVQGTCVDVDEQRLLEMRELYPQDWLWITADAWEAAAMFDGIDETWDVVSLDPFSGDMMRRVIEDLELWCSLAKRYVIFGATTLATGFIAPPAGWKALPYVQRTSDVYWVPLEKEGRE